MDFKLGLKLKNEDVDISIFKDEVDPVFTTQQTDSIFILTSHLKGYGTRDIKIEINEDGSTITVSGEKQVRVIKKLVRFRKTFVIPEGVLLDKIKARFDQDELKLTIWMPKSLEGPMGIGIQELKEVENPGEWVSSKKQDHEMKNVDQENAEMEGSNYMKQEELFRGVNKPQHSNEPTPKNNQECGQGIIEEENDIQEAKPPERSSIICTPTIAGSALFVSLIVVVWSLIRSKSKSTKNRN